jgi:hypothetical protein
LPQIAIGILAGVGRAGCRRGDLRFEDSEKGRRVGTLARIHAQLANADVAIFASSGVTDGRRAFGYVVYVRPADIEKAEAALGL